MSDRAAQQAVVVRLGTLALAGQELAALMRTACAELARALGADYVGVLEYVGPRDAFITSAGVGIQPYGPAGTVIDDPCSQARLTLGSAEPVIVRDPASTSGSAEASLLRRHGLVSAIAARVPGPQAPFGVITVQSTERRHFNLNDGVFVQAVANILAAAIARSEGEEQIRHQALHDPVTGLPNRMLFEDRVTRALATVSRRGRRLAVLYLDLDNFKLVNDSLGYGVGDNVLRAVSERLVSCLRAEDTLARFGGDEFALLLPEIGDKDGAVTVVERLRETLRAPLTTQDRQIVTSASVGIAMSAGGRQSDDPQTLIRDADLAMHAAKRHGPASSEFFAEHMYETAVRRLDLTGDLYQALERDQLELHFQPIVALDDEAIVGMEALVRWNHPRRGLLPPIAFLPLAEETGLIVPLGRFVLRAACHSLRRWQRAQRRHRDLYISVNLGAQELNAPDLALDVKSILHDTGLASSALILEVTEGVLLATDQKMVAQMLELKRLGIRLAIDDFGTGYSALHYLQSFPMDIIKIDKTFVDGLGETRDQDRLVRGIIELAHGLDLETVAEGIERAEQATKLRAMHAGLGQGFHFAKPLRSRDMDAILSPVPVRGVYNRSLRTSDDIERQSGLL